jgi:hypothetical protein
MLKIFGSVSNIKKAGHQVSRETVAHDQHGHASAQQ